MQTADAVLVSVGNTRTRVAALAEGKLQPSRVADNTDTCALAGLVAEVGAGGGKPVVVASVNDPVAGELIGVLGQKLPGGEGGVRITRVVAPGAKRTGSEVSMFDVPIRHALLPPVTVGVDRLLAAMGAHARSGEACVVIDAGTAITVDFVDSWGVFQGGCIAPGLTMSLRALHEQTAALPLVDRATLVAQAAATDPLGRTTADALALGCLASARGLVHRLIDQYAAVNSSYPRVIATGGDAPLLFEHDDLVEHIVPDLVLIGLQAALETGGLPD